MKHNLLTLFVLINFSCFSQEDVHVVLFSGQSNMAGQGISSEIDAVLKKRIQKIGDRVLISTSDENNKKAKPLSSLNKRFGPELMVGLTLAEANPNQHYLFVKKAVGGTSLYGAWSTEWTQEKANLAERGEVRRSLKLFETHLKNIRRNLDQLKKEGKSYKILAALWFQGESDTNKEITATSYEENLQKLILGYRKEFDEKLLFIIGQINVIPRKYKKGPEQVRNAMLTIANADKNNGIIETSTDPSWSDYPKHEDNLHYNTEGQKRLGIAFANKLIELLK